MGFGISEIAIILIVALLVIGPDKLPEMAKTIGKGYGEFKRAFGDIKKSVDITADINSKDNPQGAKTYAQTYKSRWEEAQAAPAVEQEADTEKKDAPAEETPTVAPSRAKRSDLINS